MSDSKLEQLNAAKAAATAGNHQAVVDALSGLKGSVPGAPERPWEISLMLGKAQLALGQISGALESLLAASKQEQQDLKRFKGKKTKKKPTGMSSFLGAKAALFNGDPNTAIKLCQQALVQHKSMWQLNDVMAVAYGDAGRFDAALDNYHSLIKSFKSRSPAEVAKIKPVCGATLASLANEHALDRVVKPGTIDEQSSYEILEKPTKEELLERCILPGRPAIIRGLLDDWPAQERWTVEQLRADYGDRSVKISISKNITNNLYHSKKIDQQTVPLKTFLEQITSDQPVDKDASQPYLFTKNPFPEIVADYQHPEVFDLLNWPKPVRNMNALFYIGPPASGVSLHQHSAAWNALLVGEKQWFCLPPFRHYGPILSDIRTWQSDYYDSVKPHLIEVTQKAGEIFYVPQYMYHGVLNKALSIGVVLESGVYGNIFDELMARLS